MKLANGTHTCGLTIIAAARHGPFVGATPDIRMNMPKAKNTSQASADLEGCSCAGRHLDKFLQPAVLAILGQKPQHGYVVLEQLRVMPMLEGQAPDSAGVYRLLNAMEERGLVRSHWDTSRSGPAKKLFRLTDSGRECLAIDVARRLGSDDVLERLTDLFIRRGVPGYLRSDNGSEFTARAVRRWLDRVGVRTLYIEPGSPWENGYIESFNGKLQDELLKWEVFDTLWEAKVRVERWRREYNQVRPHSALGYRPPAPETREPLPPGSATLRLPAMAPQH